MEVAAIGIAAGGAAVLGGAILGARQPVIHPREIKVFQAINGLPDWLYLPLWLPMQLGNLVVGTLVGLVVAWALGSVAVGVGVVAAAAAKLLAERLLRREMEPYFLVRQRPGSSQPVSVQRGADVPITGMSFPSGHVILVAAVGTVLTIALPVQFEWIPFVFALLVALGRVYVGAHNPLDVVAGLGAGLLIGGILAVPLDLLLG